MAYFHYQNNELWGEQVPLTKVAKEYGTPCYVYSKAAFTHHYQAFAEAFPATQPHKICYAVKANSNLAVLNLLAKLGAGFDVVSAGELKRVIAAGGDPGKTVFSGVGKQADEIAFALKSNIYCLNVESVAELKLISQIATELAITAPVSLRINPDIDVTTHPYITTGLKANKFGIPFEEALDTYQLAHHLDHIAIKGIDCHIGSQITELAPFVDALKRCLSLVDQLAAQGIAICHVDIGGGLGVNYQQQSLPSVKQYITALIDPLQGRKLELIVEPGRAIAAQAGLLLTQVHSIKSNTDKHFAIVDGAMNDLLRPALYQSWHPVRPVVPNGTVESKLYDIVGPVCETGDFLAKDRELAIKAGDLIAIEAAGAYGFVMSSNYNSRCRAAEVMLDGQHIHLIRQRETWQQLIAGEQLLP